MSLTAAEKIRVILGRKNIKMAELARLLNISSQNLLGKMKRNNFSEKDISQIAEVLNCDFDVTFTFRDTGEKL